MSKRKYRTARDEQEVGGASKKLKTADSGEAEPIVGSINQESAHKTDGHTVSTNRGLKNKGRFARKQSRKASRKRKVGAAGKKENTQQTPRTSPPKETKQHSRRKESGWQVSDAVGGYLVDFDPVFSIDDKYLLLAYRSSIRVYGVHTSLLIRTLSISTKQNGITAFALSASNPSQLYIALSQGLVEKWDWKVGQRLGKWTINSQISNITVASQISHNVEEDLVYTVDGRAGSWLITAHHLRLGKGLHQTEAHTLYKSTEPISSFKVLESGSVVIASVGRCLILGNIASPQASALQNMKYTWREVTCPELITSFDVRIGSGHKEAVGGGTSKASPQSPTCVNIATGGLRGSVYVYIDLLAYLVQKERKKNMPIPVARHLHWHRTGVGAVKWSADGNYIISGGGETVLTLWQLDTGQKQLLPHLSARIEGVVVSPSGNSYAIRLADNSAMVVSTAELQPIVSVPGIQVAAHRPPSLQVPDLSRITELTDRHFIFRRPAAAISRSSADQLLLAVPGELLSHVGISGPKNAAYLQTLDIRSGSQASRQALTRTKVTDKNIGPEANFIEEPNVVLLQTGHDGQWLATVEEWTPPRQDIHFLARDEQDTIEKQISQMEIYLKFWQRDAVSQQWELVSRIEAPHHSSDHSSQSIGRILDLLEDPSCSGFSTAGDNGTVKIWRPKLRYRDGVKVKSRKGQSLVTWSCRRDIPLTVLRKVEYGGNSKITARLAQSTDGSLLVAGYQSVSSSSLHLIDIASGNVRTVRSDIFAGPLIGLGLIDRYLIVLAENLVVWDIIDDRIQYETTIRSYGLSSRRQIDAMHFAVDQQSKNFAVAIPEITKFGSETRIRSRLAVFEPTQLTPISMKSLPQTLIALLPLEQMCGYVTIDTAAEVRTLTPNPHRLSLLVEQKAQPARQNNLENSYNISIGTLLDQPRNSAPNALLLNGSPESVDTLLVDSPGDDVLIVRQRELTEIFDSGNPLALPSITALFEQVVGLFLKKPST
ncbi:hypothetical protein MMC26_007707 [Xylographa opegraphella]|nr:hypothetical protein [Xylographa opegraphella]